VRCDDHAGSVALARRVGVAHLVLEHVHRHHPPCRERQQVTSTTFPARGTWSPPSLPRETTQSTCKDIPTKNPVGMPAIKTCLCSQSVPSNSQLVLRNSVPSNSQLVLRSLCPEQFAIGTPEVNGPIYEAHCVATRAFFIQIAGPGRGSGRRQPFGTHTFRGHRDQICTT